LGYRTLKTGLGFVQGHWKKYDNTLSRFYAKPGGVSEHQHKKGYLMLFKVYTMDKI